MNNNLKKINIALLGGSGSLGSIISNKISLDKQLNLIQIQRSIYEKDIEFKKEIIQWNFKDFTETILSVFNSADIIINAVGMQHGSNEDLVKINFDFVNSLVLNLIKLKKKIHLIQISSAGAYGALEKYWPKKVTVDETFSDFPSNYYEKTKSMADNMIISKLNSGTENITYTILRPTTVLTEKHSNYFNYVNFFLNKNIFLIFRNKSLFNFVSGDDVANLVALCCKNTKKISNKSFIISNDCDQFFFFQDFDKIRNKRRIFIHIPFFVTYSLIYVLNKNKITMKFSNILKVLTTRVRFSGKSLLSIFNLHDTYYTNKYYKYFNEKD